MSKRWIKAASTSQTIDIFVLDSSSTIGAGLTGLVFNTAGLTCYYRKGALGTPTAITLATLALVTTAWSSGGFIAVDGTNMPGVYRIDIPNVVIDTAGMVTMYLRGATNMAPVVLELEIVAVDIYDTVRLGLTALPNTAVTTNGSLITAGTGTAQLTTTSGVVTVGTINASVITAASIATDAIDADALATDAVTEIADGILARDIGSGSNALTALNERTVRSALRALRNKSSIATALLTVTTENDTTTAWTAAVSSSATADPVTGVDPD